MGKTNWLVALVLAAVMVVCNVEQSCAETEPAQLEKAMSDTLDVWREGKYEQLYEQLAHRGKTSREAFVKKMSSAPIRPACCWQKMENFKVLNEKRTEATVYVKVGLEGTSDATNSVTREFKLTHQEGMWKMHLPDVVAIAGVGGKKTVTKRHAKKHGNFGN